MLYQSGGYVITWLMFITFVSVNGGVVVGDKDAHQVSFHPTQVLYFCAFCLALNAPYQATKIVRFLRYVRKHVFLTAATLAVISAIVHFFTLAHPYLLADNR